MMFLNMLSLIALTGFQGAKATAEAFSLGGNPLVQYDHAGYDAQDRLKREEKEQDRVAATRFLKQVETIYYAGSDAEEKLDGIYDDCLVINKTNREGARPGMSFPSDDVLLKSFKHSPLLEKVRKIYELLAPLNEDADRRAIDETEKRRKEARAAGLFTSWDTVVLHGHKDTEYMTLYNDVLAVVVECSDSGQLLVELTGFLPTGQHMRPKRKMQSFIDNNTQLWVNPGNIKLYVVGEHSNRSDAADTDNVEAQLTGPTMNSSWNNSTKYTTFRTEVEYKDALQTMETNYERERTRLNCKWNEYRNAYRAKYPTKRLKFTKWIVIQKPLFDAKADALEQIRKANAENSRKHPEPYMDSKWNGNTAYTHFTEGQCDRELEEVQRNYVNERNRLHHLFTPYRENYPGEGFTHWQTVMQPLTDDRAAVEKTIKEAEALRKANEAAKQSVPEVGDEVVLSNQDNRAYDGKHAIVKQEIEGIFVQLVDEKLLFVRPENCTLTYSSGSRVLLSGLTSTNEKFNYMEARILNKAKGYWVSIMGSTSNKDLFVHHITLRVVNKRAW